MTERYSRDEIQLIIDRFAPYPIEISFVAEVLRQLLADRDKLVDGLSEVINFTVRDLNSYENGHTEELGSQIMIKKVVEETLKEVGE